MITGVTDDEFSELVAAPQRSTFLYFSAPWCGPCRMVGPHFERIAASHADRADFVAVDIDQAPRAGAAFAVQATPTLVYLDADGRQERRSGALMRTELEQWVTDCLTPPAGASQR